MVPTAKERIAAAACAANRAHVAIHGPMCGVRNGGDWRNDPCVVVRRVWCRLFPAAAQRDRYARWAAAHPEQYREIQRRHNAKTWGDGGWYEAHAEQERERSRRRYWEARGYSTPQLRQPRPRLSDEERVERRRESNRKAVLRYRAAHHDEIRRRESARLREKRHLRKPATVIA